jgi:ferredoxin-NADP reductase
MPFLDRLECHLGDRLRVYSGADTERLDIAATLAAAPDDVVIYVCGPQRLIGAVTDTAKKLGIPRERVRLELFA